MTGPGGVGKTRLAVAVADGQPVGRTATGSWWSPWRPSPAPHLVLPEVARALGLVGVEGLDPAAAVAEHLALGAGCCWCSTTWSTCWPRPPR